MRRLLTMTVVLGTATLGLTACGSDSDPATPTGGGGASAGPVKVGVAYDVGGRGDQSFNDSAARGLDEARKTLGVTGKESEATSGESEAAREERLQSLVDGGYSTVVAVGFAYAKAVGKVAKDNPNARFAIVDDASAESRGANVQQITFAEHQGSYLVGAAAALRSKSKKIGFVGGVQSPLIRKFAAGYTAGAKKIDPAVQVQVTYLGQLPDISGFGDPAKGRTAAEGMFQNGADVVFHAAGSSGAGVFDAAKAAGSGRWAIGVDSDQALKAGPAVRPLILTSMIKNVDVSVVDFVRSVKDGTFKGGPKEFDLAEGGVSYSTTGGHVDDIKPRLEQLKQEIVAGRITVPSS